MGIVSSAQQEHAKIAVSYEYNMQTILRIFTVLYVKVLSPVLYHNFVCHSLWQEWTLSNKRGLQILQQN